MNGANISGSWLWRTRKTLTICAESPSLTIIELLQKEGAQVNYNDPFFATVGRGRKYNLEMKNTSTRDNLQQFDCVLIVTHHSSYDYAAIVEQANLVVDTRNATKAKLKSAKIVHC